MTFEQILLIYIYKHKKVNLHEFGTLEMKDAIPEPELLKKEKSIRIEGLSLDYKPNKETDSDFVDFFADQKGRIRPLAASDIDMFLSQVKQIVNIGNPYEIPGLGKLLKMDNGIITILPGYYEIPLLPGTDKPPIIRERAASQVPNRKQLADADAQRKANAVSIKQFGVATILLLVLGGIIWLAIAFILPLFQNNNDKEADVVIPSKAITTEKKDSLPKSIAVENDSTTMISWKAYIREMNGITAAYKVWGLFKSYGSDAYIDTNDSSTYRLYIPIESVKRDTAFKRDSMRKFYARPIRLERMPE